MSNLSKEWYTTVEVAELLGRSDRYVRDRVKGGQIPAQLGGGARRVSYKISREALVGWMMREQRQGVAQVAKVLKNVEDGFLAEVAQIVQEEMLARKSHMKLCARGEAPKGAGRRLEAKRLKEEFIFAEEAVYERYHHNPLNFTSTLIDTRTGVAEAHFGVEVTSVEFFDALCAGRVKDDYQPPWERGQTPIFYVDVLIIDDPLWAPFLFKHMASKLKAFMQKERLEVKACFAIGSAPEAVRLMEKYGFSTVTKFEGKYPIMLNKDITQSQMGRYLR